MGRTGPILDRARFVRIYISIYSAAVVFDRSTYLDEVRALRRTCDIRARRFDFLKEDSCQLQANKAARSTEIA